MMLPRIVLQGLSIAQMYKAPRPMCVYRPCLAEGGGGGTQVNLQTLSVCKSSMMQGSGCWRR